MYEKIDSRYRTLGYCLIKKSFLNSLLLMEMVARPKSIKELKIKQKTFGRTENVIWKCKMV